MMVLSPAIAAQIGLLLRRTLQRLFFVLQKSDVENPDNELQQAYGNMLTAIHNYIVSRISVS